MSLYKSVFKRLFDIFLAIISLILLFPFLLIVSILIKIDTKGPILYIQKRLGKNESLFDLYKFRSMTDKHRENHRQIFEGDVEVTRAGRFLRRTKLDELPQLMNVIFGEMSIIGPRPCLVSTKESFGKYAEKRFDVKPGISSLAATKGSIYLSWEEKGYWDEYYVNNVSFKLDALIIFKTINVVIFGEKKMFKNLKQ